MVKDNCTKLVARLVRASLFCFPVLLLACNAQVPAVAQSTPKLANDAGASWAPLRDGGLASRIQSAIARGRASNPFDNAPTTLDAPALTSAAPTLTRKIRPQSKDDFRKFFTARGGEPTFFAPYNNSFYFPTVTDRGLKNLSFLGQGVAANEFSVEFYTDARAIELDFSVHTGRRYNLIVDDRFVEPDGIVSNAAYFNSDVVRLDFGSRQVRKIRFEGYGADAWRGVNVAATDAVWPTKSPLKIAIIGDSITEGAGDPNFWGWARDVSLLMEGADVLPMGLGATGYIADRQGDSWPFASHLETDLLRGETSPDMIVFAGGINDRTSLTQAAVENCLRIARRVKPSAAIVAMGAFAGSSGPSAGVLSAESKIMAAVSAVGDDNTYFMPVSSALEPWIFGTGREGAPHSDGNSDIYTSADATHPNRAGHAHTARRFIEGLAQSVLPQIAPTGLALAPSSIAENQPAGSLVGALTANGPDANASFTYSLVSGAGSGDNASFSIAGGALKSKASFDYETKKSYAIRVKSSDGNGGTFTQAFAISVTDVNEETPSLIVTTTADVEAEDGVTSLREAIAFANRDGAGSAISFDETVFANPQTIALGGTQLTLTGDGAISIGGPAAGVTISGRGNSRVFNVSESADATLVGLTISQGHTLNVGGGGVLNLGKLALNNCTISGNSVDGQGSNNLGGGILSSGAGSALTLTNCTLAGNAVNGDMAGNAGGGIASLSALTLTHCTVTGNVLGGADNAGGGIFSAGSFDLFNSLVVSNAAVNGANIAGEFSGGANITAGTALAAGLDPIGLNDNGGAVPTIALSTRGTAVNKGDGALESGPTTDARGDGFPRRVGGAVDIGAFESPFANRPPQLNNATYSTSIDVPFSQQLAASDADDDTLFYARSRGRFPDGITLNRSTGVLAGTPTVAGRFDFSINVFDGKDVAVARFIIIVSTGADGIGPRIVRDAMPATFTRDQLAAFTVSGLVTDAAPAGVTPSGVAQMLVQLRRDNTSYSGPTDGFTSNTNRGYYSVNLGTPAPNTTAGTRGYTRALDFVPAQLTPGNYSLVVAARDVAGNFSVEVVPFTLDAVSAPARFAPVSRATPKSPSGGAS